MHLSFVRTRLQDVIQLCLRGQRIGPCSVIQDISVGEPSANILLHPTDLLQQFQTDQFHSMHNVVLVNGGDMVDVNQQENRSWKSWVGVWRTIIRSSLNKTMYPYCHYLRNLNLGELEQILDDLDSKPGVEKKFKTYSTTS